MCESPCVYRALRRLKVRVSHCSITAISSGAKVAIILIAVIILTVSSAFAEAQKRDFPEVLVTEDATPDNTLEIGPGWNREHNASDFNFEASIEKKLSENTSLEVTMAYDSITRSLEHSSQGIDNLEILGKWELFHWQPHELIVTLAAQVFPSTGDPAKGAETHTRAGPVLLWEKGLGDLPDAGLMHYIRPLGLLNELSYLPTWGGPESGEFVFNFALQYPLQYLADSGEQLQLSAVSAGFTPFIEFNYDQVAIGKRRNTPPDFRISQGIAYQYGPYQLTVGTQVPLNRYASHGLQAAVLTLIDIDLEPLIPGAGVTLF